MSYGIHGSIIATQRGAVRAALEQVAGGKVYVFDDNEDIDLSGDGYQVVIYPDAPAPEGGVDFLVRGDSQLSADRLETLIGALTAALDGKRIAFQLEITGPGDDDARVVSGAHWDLVSNRRDAAAPVVTLGDQLRTGQGDEVRLGTYGGARVLITLTLKHTQSWSELAADLALGFDGIAPLVTIGAAQAPYDDMMIEELPAGRPASDVAQLSIETIAKLGAAVAEVVARAHAAGAVIDGICPELIYVRDDGTFAGLAPRGPRFVHGAPPSGRGMRSYRVPYIGHEGLVLGKPASAATDVFALSASLFVLGHGTHPFGDPSNLGQLVARMVADQREAWPQGGALAQLLARGLAQRPEDRPTAAVLAGELALIASGAR